MKFRIDYTIEIPDDLVNIAALHEVSCARNRRSVHDFLIAEAEEHVITYLEGMGVQVKVVRSNGVIM